MVETGMKILAAIAAFIVLLLIVLGYYGLFHPIEIRTEPAGPFILAYEKHRGDYRETAGVMDKIHQKLSADEKIATTRGFGLYYDNPAEVEKEQLRSIAGCIIEEKDRDRITELSGRFNIANLAPGECILCEHPYRGKISILIGIARIYPRLSGFMKDNGFSPKPVMEIYDIPNSRIIYIVPVNIDDIFFGELLKD